MEVGFNAPAGQMDEQGAREHLPGRDHMPGQWQTRQGQAKTQWQADDSPAQEKSSPNIALQNDPNRPTPLRPS